MILQFVRKNFIIILITILALGLRLYGTHPGYPDYHPDEGTTYTTAIHMLYNNLKPDRVDYPAGMPLINLIAYILLFIPLTVANLIFSHPSFYTDLTYAGIGVFYSYKDHIFGPGEINALYWSRYVTAFIGGATILITYIAAKKMFTKEVGLFAAFFLAVNYLHVARSHFALPDIYNSFFGVLSLLASVLLLEKNTRKRYIFAAVTVAVFFSIKFLLFALGPYIIAHVWWAYLKRDWRYLFHKNFIISLFIIPIVFLLLNPYLFSDLTAFIKRSNYTALRYHIGEFEFRPYGLFYLFFWGIGPLPSIAIILGGILMALKSVRNFLLIFSFVAALFFTMIFYSIGGLYTRNFVTVTPYLMIFAGFFMYSLFTLLKRNKFLPHTFLILLTIIFFNFTSIQNSFILSYYYAKPWSVAPFTQWVEQNLPSGAIVRSYQLFLPRPQKEVFAKKNIVLKDWNYSTGPNSLAEFQEEGTQFAILNTNPLQSITYWWRQTPHLFIGRDNIPFDYIQNSFYGLTIKELSNYTISETYKPWQAQYNPNYIVFKIPKKPKDLGRKIAQFGFDKDDEKWKIRGLYGFEPLKMERSKSDGIDASGALKIEPLSHKRTVIASGKKTTITEYGGSTDSRISSPAIAIDGDTLYTVRAFILNTPKGPSEERDGFIRLDFYKEKNDQRLEEAGDVVAISQRAFASGEWEEVQVSMRSPKNAKFITISVQRKQIHPFASFVDDIQLYESQIIPEEQFKEIPYIKPTIPLESLYYNSFL